MTHFHEEYHLDIDMASLIQAAPAGVRVQSRKSSLTGTRMILQQTRLCSLVQRCYRDICAARRIDYDLNRLNEFV